MTDTPHNPTPAAPVLEYGTGRENAFVSLAGFPSETEAHLAASCLEGEGIICRVAVGKTLGGMGTYHAMVFVWPDDLGRAREVLSRTPAKRFLDIPAAPVPVVNASATESPPPVARVAPTPMLGYVQGPTRYGVAIEREGAAVRVLLPTGPLRYSLLGCVPIVGVFGIRAVAIWQDGGIPVVSVLVILGAVLGVILTRKWREVFEVDDAFVRIGDVRASGEVTWKQVWPRASVGEIRYSRINGHLLIRITGQDLLEFRLPGDVKTKEEITAVLAAQLANSTGTQ